MRTSPPVAVPFLLLLGTNVESFLPPTSVTNAPCKSSTSQTPPTRTKTFLNAIDPQTLHEPLTHLHTLSEQSLPFVFQQDDHIISSTSNLLADAAAAADVTLRRGPQWWQNYISVYKGLLVTIHSTIEGPLKSVGISQTWGPSIALFTAAVRACLVPFSVQQTKNAEYMKALKPYQDEIKAKFADRTEIMNRAIAKLYEDAGTNPLAGCFVSLAQIPIFLGLYRGVRYLAQEGQLNEPFLWIPSLEGPVGPPTWRGMDWLLKGWTTPEDGGLPIPSMGWETTIAFLVMPVLLVLAQSFTMSVLQPPVDENLPEKEKAEMEKSSRIIKFLPLLIGYFSLQVPAGLTIYWLTSNCFTLLQTLAVKAYYKANPPEINLPEYWDALDDMDSMTPDQKRAAAEAGVSVGPKYEDLLDEARYHYVVERNPLREESASWGRVLQASTDAEGAQLPLKIPPEFEAWVAAETQAAAAVEVASETEAEVEAKV